LFCLFFWGGELADAFEKKGLRLHQMPTNREVETKYFSNIFGSLQKSHRLRSFGSDNEAKEIVPQILRAVSLARLLFAIALIQPASFVSDLRDRSVFSAFPFRWDDFPQTISTHADTAATRAAAPDC
jgi:hypothetical protein